VTATRIDLVRHGHVENPQRKVYGRLPGWKLSAEGREEARATAAYLGNRPIVRIYTSPLERAHETAAAIASVCGAPVEIEDALIESALGAHWEGMKWAEVRSTRLPELDAYLHRPHEVDFVEEPFDALGQRMAQALRTIASRHPGQEVVAVSHGDPIKAALCALHGRPISTLHERRVRTGGLVALEIEGATVRVVEEWEPRRPTAVKARTRQ
jgi:broad specificity phosphatase PhoE